MNLRKEKKEIGPCQLHVSSYISCGAVTTSHDAAATEEDEDEGLYVE